MSRKQESITLSVTTERKTNLELLALEFDCLWGENPSISELARQIADGDILLSKSSKSGKPDKKERKMIKDAIASIQSALTILLELI